MLTLLLIELITSSLLFFLLPLALIVLAVPDLAGDALSWPGFGEMHTLVAAHVTLTAVLFGVVLPDYLLTCAVAMLERQPRLLLLGVFFPFLRMLDACIGLYAIPVAWLSRSSGRWKSPARRAVEPAAGPGEAQAASRSPIRRAVPARCWQRGAGTRCQRPGTCGRARPDTVPASRRGPTPHSPARVAEASHVSG